MASSPRCRDRCGAISAPWLAGHVEEQALRYAISTLVPNHLAEVNQRRIAEIDKVEIAVRDRLTREINYWDMRGARLREEERAGKEQRIQPRIVSLWRHRYADQGLEGLQDKPRPGKQPIYTNATDKRILKLLDKPPPDGFARWTGPLLAGALGDVDVQYVWRFLRSHKIDLAVRKSWCESNDPNFTAKAADVVGLYVAPPAKAIVLCVDEKPSIQALERAQGYLKLPNGRALTGQSHDYKRHGTTTLFAALEVATGKIIAAHSKRRRRVEFLDFMNSVTAAFPGRKLHVILDNLNTHKKNEHWLKAHPNVQFHFTPKCVLAQSGRGMVFDLAGAVA
jgi:DDE superfamily endonuclease/Homeodomain-like domain